MARAAVQTQMTAQVLQNRPQAGVSFERESASSMVVHLRGKWQLGNDMPSGSIVAKEFSKQALPARIVFDASELTGWDSALISFLVGIYDFCRAHGIEDDRTGLPAGVRRLVELAEAVPEKQGARAGSKRNPFFERIGDRTVGYISTTTQTLSFVGDAAVALGKAVRRSARYRSVDLAQNISDCGPSAVGIVSLISFLVGVILAFMGAVQLQQFGASIYVADLVGIGMLREMGAMMTAIIMSGRTGAAFAAQLGTMKVTQEVDALTTMGISPFQFLLLPRVIALVLMMPLLCLYSDLLGILGGAFVGVGMLGLSFTNYMRETIHALSLTNLLLGLIKATIYGGLIAFAGCLRGFQCGNSSSAVGDAATRAVVTSIVLVVVACGLFAFVTNLVGV
jgi:phospholipid/cholesterol/gamma-HCH transport system permease protein